MRTKRLYISYKSILNNRTVWFSLLGHVQTIFILGLFNNYTRLLFQIKIYYHGDVFKKGKKREMQPCFNQIYGK